MKISKIGKNLTVVLSDGTLLSNSECTDDLFQSIKDNLENEETIRNLLTPKKLELEIEIEEKQKFYDKLRKSELLTTVGNSVYLTKVSELTLPQSLAEAIFKAEEDEDEELVQTYTNFWTLCCLNPDSRARTNLFWFLEKYGITISKSGLFVAYRNVDIKQEGTVFDTELTQAICVQYARIKFKSKKSPKKYTLYYNVDDNVKEYKVAQNHSISSLKFQNCNNCVVGNLKELYDSLSKEGATVYTDNRTGKMNIVMGKPVSMPRSKCDSKQENTCSSGLHVASKEWLIGAGAFGKISILVLVNPADVVAVPPQDGYGKMRTCRYYPVKVIDDKSNLIDSDEEYDNGFEDDFMNQIIYSGEFNNEASFDHTLFIPEIPEISREKILNRLEDIANSMNKVV